MAGDKIAKVASVAQSAKQQSGQQFKISQQNYRSSCDQLEQLQKFKREYEVRLETMGEQGMAARQLQDFRQFLGKLNQAIEQQNEAIRSAEQDLAATREQWLAKSQRSSALDQMVDQRKVKQQQELDKAEQRESDEISLARSGTVPED